MDMWLVAMMLFIAGAMSGAVGYIVSALVARRERRRLQDIIMALDDSADTPAWERTFGRTGKRGSR